jgi:hypothetical protein
VTTNKAVVIGEKPRERCELMVKRFRRDNLVHWQTCPFENRFHLLCCWMNSTSKHAIAYNCLCMFYQQSNAWTAGMDTSPQKSDGLADLAITDGLVADNI